ncbi:translational elongation factor EF-1 alpha [Puccinia graminis f. sp. tritici]|uniref:Translational elongation factor EF-1 alpha n=1 Tax=Puccinia graminis f. sp. tritici TaxID=56615 RepID=A0A5B0MQ96_PUCGR|nr:translational elongation factor EF-1 alpha [Puccinia graminis f. sp. tritici]
MGRGVQTNYELKEKEKTIQNQEFSGHLRVEIYRISQDFDQYIFGSVDANPVSLLTHLPRENSFSWLNSWPSWILKFVLGMFMTALRMARVAQEFPRLPPIYQWTRTSAREVTCTLLSEHCTQSVGHAVEPFLLAHGDHQVLNELVEALGDKLPAVSGAALSAVNSLVKIMTPWTRHLILRVLLNRIATASKWQVETGALKVLDVVVVSAAKKNAHAMPEFVPVLATAIWDTTADVKKAARSSLTKSFPVSLLMFIWPFELNKNIFQRAHAPGLIIKLVSNKDI